MSAKNILLPTRRINIKQAAQHSMNNIDGTQFFTGFNGNQLWQDAMMSNKLDFLNFQYFDLNDEHKLVVHKNLVKSMVDHIDGVMMNQVPDGWKAVIYFMPWSVQKQALDDAKQFSLCKNNQT